MADKNWWDSHKEKDTNVGNWWDKYDTDKVETIGKKITDSVNNWMKSHQNYVANYQNRTKNRKYDYSDDYVKDPNDWLMKVSEQKKAFDASADSILAYMDRYKGYLDAEWMKSVQDALSGARAQQDIVVGNATADSKWWSNFANEDEYKTAQRYDGYNKKYSGMNQEAIATALGNLQDGEEKNWLDSYQWRRLMSNEDFNKYEQAGASIKNPSFEDAEDGGRILWWEWGGDDIGNIVTYSRENADYLASAAGDGTRTAGNYVYRSMNDDEVKVYNYILAKYGKEKGDEFLSHIMDDLNAREGGALAERLKSIDIPVVEELAIGTHGLLAGVDQWASGVRQNFTNEVVQPSIVQYSNSALADSMDGLGKYAYQATNVVGNMLPSIAVSKGLGALGAGVKAAKLAGVATMSVGAAGNAYADGMKEYGMEPWQARTYGTLVGVAEGALEYAIGGIPALRGAEDFVGAKIGLIDNALLRIGAKIGWDVVSEIGEEELQNYLEPAFRAIFTHEYDAPTIDELIETAIVTAISTPFMGGGETVMNDIHRSRNAVKQYGEFTDDLIKEGLESDQNSESYRLAQQFQQQVQGYTDKKGKQIEGKALSGNQIANLVDANTAQFKVEDFNEARKQAKDKLTQLGENASEVWPIAELVAKKVTGQELTRAEKRKLVNSFGSKVAHDMENPTVETQSGTRAYNATYKSITERTGEKRQYNVAEDGKAKVQESGNAFDLSKAAVTDIKKDKRTGKVTDVTFMADGKEVQASGIQFADESQSFLVEAVSNMENITPKDATAIIHDVVDTTKPLGEQLNGIDQAFNYGFWDYSVNDLQAGEFVGSLSTQQMMSAYALGKAARRDSNLVKDAPVVKMRTALEAQMSAEQNAAQQKANFESDDVQVYFLDKNSGATTKFDGNIDKYEDNKAATIRATQILSKMRIGGSGFYLYESYEGADGVRYYKDENGVEKKAPHGFYRETDGRIYIDLNAGEQGQGVGLFTLSHELTHFVKHRSEAQFKKLGDLVTEAYGKTNKSMDQRVLEKQAELKEVRGGKDVSYTEAYEEVLCDAMSTMISDGNFFEKVAEIKVKDKGLFNTMKRFFQEMFAKFKEVYKKLTPDQQDAIDIRQMKDMFDRIQTAFAEAVVEVSDNFQAQQEMGAEMSNEDAFMDSETAIHNQIRPPYSDGSKAFNQFVDELNPEARKTFDLFYGFYQKSRITNTLSVSGKKVKAVNISSLYLLADEWNDMLSREQKWADAAKALADFLPENVRKRMNMNEDGSLNPTMLEKEFKMPSSMAQRLVDALAYEKIDATYQLGNKTITLPTVESRQSVGGEAYRRAIIDETRKLFEEGKLKKVGIGTMSKDRWGSLGFLAANGKTGASGDFTTVCPQMMFNRGCWYCYRRAAMEKGVNNKLVANSVWYTGEILRIKDSDIEALNRNGGLRIQSFGDWMPHFSAMLADVLYDAELRGLQVKIITKEPSMINYIAALREQGIGKNLYFNLSADYTIERGPARQAKSPDSLDTVNPERPYLRNTDNGFWWKRAMTVEEANKYRQKYPWVNTRIVATTLDEFIRGLQDSRVDVVTGYHGNIREFERVDSTTGEHKVNVEALGDAGMPRFAFNPATGKWVTEYEGKTQTHKRLAQAIAENNLQMEYYTKTCCITGRCATCEGKCGALARDFNVKNATNRDSESIAYWQKQMQYAIEPEFGDMTVDEQAIDEEKHSDRYNQIASDFTSHMKNIVETKKGWYAKDVFKYVEEHPELGFIELIYAKDKDVKKLLEKFLNGVDDVKVLENLSWFMGEAYGDKDSTWSWADGSSYPYRGAVRTFRNAIKKRINAIMTEKVGGTNLGIKNGEVTLEDVKGMYSKLNSNEEMTEFAEKVFSTAEKLGVNIRFVNQTLSKQRVAGDNLGDMVEYKTSYFNDTTVTDQKKANTILHELIHACTVYVMDANKLRGDVSWNNKSENYNRIANAAQRLNRIYGEIQYDPEFKDQYGIKNEKEMVAELSNPEFVDLLKKKNLWDKIVDWICDLFGIRRGNSAYDNARLCLDYILDNPEVSEYKEHAADLRRRAKYSGYDVFGQTRYSERVSNEELAAKDDTALYIKNTDKANYIGMIFNGAKTEETRSRRTLDAFIGKDFYVTDGKYVYGSIVLGEPHKYTEEEFHKKKNQLKHRVPVGDEYDIKPGGTKWAYPIESYKKFDKPQKLSDSKEYKNSFQARQVKFADGDTSNQDRDYLAAVKNGDMETVQRMVDEAAKVAGFTRKQFHETKKENNIHVFDLGLNTNASADYGTPFGVFTKSHNRSVGLGGKQMELFVKAENTFRVKDRTEIAKKLPAEYTELVDTISRIDAEYGPRYVSLGDDVIFGFDAWLDENDPDDKMRFAWDVTRPLEEQFGDVLPEELLSIEREHLRLGEEWRAKTDQAIMNAKKWITKWLRDNHYDSMELEFDNGAGNRVTDALILLDPNQVKSADPITYDDQGNVIPLSQRFNEENDDIRYSERTNAPVFYSKMAKVIEGMKQEKFGASSVISMLRDPKRGVKAEEIRWSGIQAFLEGKKSVTKAELLKFIKGSMLHIEEQENTGGSQVSIEPAYVTMDGESNDINVMVGGEVVDFMEWDEYNHEYISDALGYAFSDEDEVLEYYTSKYDGGGTRWGDYKLDGGDNYREFVFRMPGSTYSNPAMRAHWGDDAQGVIAHARVQDFDTADGKMLFIEEIQSDWHNEGKKNGYSTEMVLANEKNSEVKLIDNFYELIVNGERTGVAWNKKFFEAKGASVDEMKADLFRMYNNNARMMVGKKAPDAPFKNNYHEFVLKRLLRMAAEEGYDSIGWTTADIQSDRWSDEFAEGYRIEYDQDIPKFLKKYGKQWGAEVGKTMIDTRGITEWERDMLEKGIIELVPHEDEVWSMDITDAMKKSVLEEGQELYSERTGHSVSNRALLANAFEGLSQNSNEYKLIQQYKGHIAELNSLEDKLSEFRHEIRKLRFGKDEERDAQKLARLESEAKKIAEAINKHDKEILSLEASEPLRKIIEHERKKASEKTKAHVKEIQQNKKVRAEQAELRHKIRKTIRDLDKILNRGNKKTNVKEDMKDFASKALELADYLFTDHISNDELIRRGIDENLMRGNEAQLVKETEEILSKLYDNTDSLTDEEFTRLDEKRKVNEYKLRDLLTKQRNERLNTPVYNLFNDLVTEYAKLKNSKQDAVRAAYNVDLERLLRQFMGDSADGADTDRKTILQNMRVADMTTEELNKLYEAYKMVLTNIRDANKIHVIGKFASIDKMAEAITWDFSKRKIPEGKVAIIARNIANKLGWDYEKLYYALDRIGSEAFTELVMNIANSENIVMQDVMEAKAFLDEMVKQYGFNNWDVNKEIDREFLDNTGKKFKLTLGQMMSLYAYSRRKGAWDHIEYGGFVFGDAALTNPRPADSYKLSKAQCEAITSLLTEQQKGYVEAMQKFLSETMGAKGNEVSMMLYGIKMFGEKNYFPIHIAGQFKAQANESKAKQAAGFSSMSNAGFTHAQNPNAKAPFVLEGFNEIWVDHVNEMSRYHGTVPALEDMRRVMNRSSYSEATAESMAIKQLMENSYGKEAVEYFDNLYREANSGAITDKLEKNSKRLVSLFRKNSVAYSLSVLVQQPASITRAYAMIDKKYFGFKGFGTITSGIAKVVTDKWTKAHTDTYNKMLKYAPGVTMAKEIGGFDTATGGSIRSYLLDTNKSLKQKWKTGTALEKGKAVMDLVDDNAIANLPNVADKIAWCEIWNACEREAVAKHKDLKPGSDEFLKAVGERFTEVIRATQVYDSIFAKSPMLKNKRIYVQMLTSFMNEPNTVANMAESAVRDFVRGSKKVGVKKAAVLIHGIIFTGVLKSIVYAMRDDDEDETYIEKYIESLAGSLMDDFNALNYIPLARDVVSLAQGYDVERADMAIVADAVDALDKVIKNRFTETEDMTEEQLIEFDKKCTEANWKLVESLASFFGIPVKNIRREIVGVLDHARIASANRGKTTSTSTWDKIYDTVTESIPFMQTKSKQDKLYDAIISGDKEYLARMKSGYKDESAYHSAVRKALRENDPRIQEAANAKYNGNINEYKRIFKEIQNEGKFSFDDIMSAINTELSKLSPDKATSNYSASGYVEAIALGNTSNAQAMKDDIIATKMANGQTLAEAEKAFASDVATGIKNAYSAGLLTEARAEEMLVEYAGKNEEDAASKVSFWAFCEAHPKYKDILTESNVEVFHKFAEPAGISLDVYAQFVTGTKGLATIYDDWGDELKSKREQVLEVIDSLPLTWQQKDALYLAAGYSEDNIWDVPW